MEIKYLVLIIGAVLSVVLPVIAIIFSKKIKVWANIFLAVYLAALFVGVFANITYLSTSLVVKFGFSKMQAFNFNNCIWGNLGSSNVIINFLMLIPFGIYVYATNKNHKMLKCFLFGLLLSMFIEFMQLALPINRNTELFDILANTISSLFGGLLAMLIYHIKSKIKKSTN